MIVWVINEKGIVMKIRPLITHTFAMGVGLLAASSYFLIEFIPSSAERIYSSEVHNIKLSEMNESIPYSEILEKRYLSSLYGSSLLYFFKRQQSRKIDEELAKTGYWPSLDNVFGYHHWRADDPRLDGEAHSYHFNEALKWAEFAAERGYQIPMLLMITRLDLGQTEDISQELANVEGYAQTASYHGPAKMLAEYYKKKGNTEKAQHWSRVAEKIKEEKRAAPACTTITPWKGW